MEWVRLSELGDRRCDAVKWNVREIAGDNNVVTIPTNGSFHFSRRLGELCPYKPYRGGAFEFGVAGYGVTDKNLNGGETVFGGQFSFGPNGFGFVINPVTYQGFYNDRDYNIIYENDEFMWEWTEPIYYYGCLDAATGYENIGGYEEIMDYIYVRVFEGEYEEPFDPQPTIAENLDRIRVAKDDMRNAIRDKGVNILQGEPIQSYAAYIQNISRGNIRGTFVTFEDMYGNGIAEYYASNYGLDGFEFISVDANDYANQKYQEGYNRGLNETEEVISATAEVLDVTSNGTYYTKYADIPEWNEPETGDEFFSYAKLENNTYFNTGYVGNDYSVVEFWYKYDDTVTQGSNLGTVVGKQGVNGTDILKIRVDNTANESFVIERKGENRMTFTMSKDEWHKIKFSYEGVWVDDVQVVSYAEPLVFSDNVPFCINGTIGWEYGANGYYGMVKIDDNVYVPTAVGYINRDTGESLAINGQKYTFYAVEEPTPMNNLIKQVNVDLKISVNETGLKLAYYEYKSIPDFLDFSNISGENLVNFFNSAKQLEDVSRLEGIDTSEITSLEGIFHNCSNLTDLTPIGSWDISNVTRMYNTFGNCTKLTTIPALDCSSIDTSYGSTFWFSSSNMTALTNMGGFINLKTSSTGNYVLNKCPNLTYESCINILNGLYDFTGNGETPTDKQGQLKVHQNFLTTVGDEISIGTNKGWTITA